MVASITQSKNYLPHVDGLRGIAVIAVLLFHLEVSGFSGGFVGVDIFLVISGFLITNLIKKEIEDTSQFDFRRFYIRRVRRLAPALLITLLLSSVVAILIFSPGALKGFGEELLASLFSLSNIYFWLEADYFDVEAYSRPLLHTWSLSLEEQFYLLWPVFLLLFIRKARKYWIALSLAIIIAISLGMNFLFGNGIKISSTNIFLDAFQNGESTIFYLLPFRVFEFCIGSCLAWTTDKKTTETTADILLFVGVLFIAFSIFYLNKEMVFPSYNALLPCFGAALVIQFGGESRFKWLLVNRFLLAIGLMSYSLYLVHWPLIVFLHYRFGPINHIQQIAIILLSLGMAWMSCRFVETPFRSKVYSLKWLLLPTPALVIFACSFIFGNGWSWRVASPVVFTEIKSPEEFHTEYYGGKGYPSIGPVGVQAPPDILLIGDSHARHYAEGLFKEIAEPHGYHLHIIAGNSFIHLPNFTRTTPGTDWDNVSKETMSEIQKVLNYYERKPLVIISHAWTFQLIKAALIDDSGNRFKIEPDIADVGKAINKIKELFNIDRLIVIGEVPGTNSLNIYDEMTRPILGRKIKNSDLQYTNPIETTCEGVNRQFSKLQNINNNFTFIDPASVLTYNQKFINFDSVGRPLYSDPTHLSKFGSRYVI